MAKSIEAAYDDWEPFTQETYDKTISDFVEFCKRAIRITDKAGVVKPFILNEAQLDYATKFFEEYNSKPEKPIEHVILKARQMGFSTLIATIIIYTCISLRNTSMGVAYVMPIEEDWESIAREKFLPILQSMHPDMVPEIKVGKKSSYTFVGYSDKEKLDNRVSGVSASSKTHARGRMIRGLILDEYATYTNAVDLKRGIMAAVPKVGRSYKILFSTAKGQNHFFDTWNNAKKTNNWRGFFYPWHTLAEYEMDAKPIQVLTPYQEKLVAEFEKRGYEKETWLRKLTWYEYMLANEAEGDEDTMMQEYPSFEEEAFLSSGRPAFKPRAMDKLRKEAEANPVHNGLPFVYVEPISYMGQVDNIVGYFEPVSKSAMKIFDSVSPGRRYVAGVDPSDGGEMGDFSAICVVDKENLQVVASYRAKIAQEELADVCIDLAKEYNNAQIIPERNTGQALISHIRHRGYGNIYNQQKLRTGNQGRGNYGIYMTYSVRSELVKYLQFLVNNGLWKDYDPDFFLEARYFNYDDKRGRWVADAGKTDDVIMSRVLCMPGLNMRQIYSKYDTTIQNL